MLHQDFSSEIPRGMHVVDGVSHHYPSAFSLPVDFYDVRLHSVIVGPASRERTSQTIGAAVTRWLPMAVFISKIPIRPRMRTMRMAKIALG